MSKPISKSPGWGLRVSVTDAIVLIATAAGAITLRRMENAIWWVLAVVVGHFFLFCNVIRMRPRFEQSWAISFILNVGFWLWRGDLVGAYVVACQLPITAAFAIVEMRSARYHGIFAARLNPHLREYLEGRQTS